MGRTRSIFSSEVAGFITTWCVHRSMALGGLCKNRVSEESEYSPSVGNTGGFRV